MRKKLKSFVWLALALSALAIVAYSTPLDAFTKSITNIHWTWVLTGSMVFFVSQSLLGTRWHLLLGVQGVHISQFQAIKLTYLGLFYNNVMPGAIGGDIIKAWYITRHVEGCLRVKAAVTVFVDRALALIGMILVASVVSLLIAPDIGYGGVQLRWLVWGISAATIGGTAMLVSKQTRKLTFVRYVLKKLPFAGVIKQIDNAVQAYRNHIPAIMLALLLNILIQGLAIVAIWMLTQALHFQQVRLLQCVVIIPIVWVIGAAVPVPAGLGIIEGSITYLFCLVINPQDPPSALSHAAALALLNRLMLTTCSLPGAVVPIFGGHLPRTQEMAVELRRVGCGLKQTEV